MDALKSPLARDLLADPKAREQLRTFLSTPVPTTSARTSAPGPVIELRIGGRTQRFKPAVVPKAR